MGLFDDATYYRAFGNAPVPSAGDLGRHGTTYLSDEELGIEVEIIWYIDRPPRVEMAYGGVRMHDELLLDWQVIDGCPFGHSGTFNLRACDA